MGNNISLTASMRSNLLSLQNISRQVSSTQNKLATGNKVNSAIDNPSSYYTARSLNNRANDLDALLDSMGQAVSTIKAATTALETGATFLEQAAAVATSALETAVPPKSYFEEKVGENGAVVTTAQELKDAVKSGKEIICVYGSIDYLGGEKISLHANQKLVGTEYYTGYTGKDRFSQLRINGTLQLYDNYVSDLTIKFSRENTTGNIYAMIIEGDKGTNVLHNVELNSMVDSPSSAYSAGILLTNTQASMTGNIIVNHQSNTPRGCGIYVYSNSVLNVDADLYTSNIDVKAELNIMGGTINVEKIDVASYSKINIDPKAEVNYGTFEKPEYLTDETKAYGKQYAEILQQYDSITKDSTYKGVNLLKNEKLNVRFNENGSADLNVNGKDMSAGALGIGTVEWSNQGDIAQSLQEIANALKSIRAFTAELGNNYSIITNRQEFTENLINILTEGADKLTLADMNEESANMLSLQTRQQLAINSLSLASQASQAVLKLF